MYNIIKGQIDVGNLSAPYMPVSGVGTPEVGFILISLFVMKFLLMLQNFTQLI